MANVVCDYTRFQSILTSRFILNLRLVDHSPRYLLTYPDGGNGIWMESLHFTDASWSVSLFGNVGAPLDIEGKNEYEEDEKGDGSLES